ncbi:Response regulator receiver protein CpdR [uncultured bacterium]|nr:Response regulator receiver protein CpdR [uncultured bacterium]
MDNAALNLSRRVLVVDDDESIRDLCGMVLRTAGYKVDVAVHGADGLGKLRQSDYDLVISDVNMPELGGLEFHEAAMNLPGAPRTFLFMSGGASEEVLLAISERGLKCLEKPFRIPELIGAVEAMMRAPLNAVLAAREAGSRKEGRLSFTDLCSVVSAAGAVTGVARDISPHGMRAEYAGEPIGAGEDVLVKVSLSGLSFERGARMVWTERADGGFVSGIEFREPMPVSSIVNIMAGGR